MKTLFAPHMFQKNAPRALPWLLGGMMLFLNIGYVGVFLAPHDAVQGVAAKLMYIHVPTAWLALFAYAMMGGISFLYLMKRLPLAFYMARALAIVGAVFCFICLATGAIWGKPMWGAWWVWDARLTSMLILFFLYMGYLILSQAFTSTTRNARMASLLGVIGLLNLPIIKWSVDWWHTLHQPASFLKLTGPSIAPSMLWPLLVCAFGWFCYMGAFVIMRTLTFLYHHQREKRSS